MNTKKTLAIISLAAIVLTAAPLASANDGGANQGRGFSIGHFFGGIISRFERKVSATNFIISGTVVSTATSSVTVTVQNSANIPSLVNQQATVNTDANTKFVGAKNVTITLANLAAGDRIEIMGNVSNSVLTATNIRDSGPAPAVPVTTSGKVTAVSSTSITLSNAINSTTQVFTIDANTKVMIDGTAKTVADIQVGDAGTIKSKTASSVFTATAINLYR